VLAQRFRDFERHGGTRAPLYARLSPAIAADDDILALLDDAPDEQRLPVLLFAAVHLLVLEGHCGELSRHYANLDTGPPADADPIPAFRHAALEHADRIRLLVATRRTQTNEIGRCALYLPALRAVEEEVGPTALVDVGASAWLNLLLEHYGYDYGQHGRIPGRSPIVLPCSLLGPPHTEVRAPDRVPRIAAAVGLDVSPINVHDDDAVRWLMACVWPDMTERYARLVDAIALARERPPRVVAGDAVSGVAGLVESSRAHGHPVVLTSWVLNYLPLRRQQDFVAALDRLGERFDLSWVIAESPAETPGLPVPTEQPPEVLTVVSLVTWRGGRRTVTRLGTAHPHGYWLRWD
jgi:hypothetical protein